MSENCTASNTATQAMREFFVSLGFAQARIDEAHCDQLLGLMVAGLSGITPKTLEEHELARELSERLAALRMGVESFSPVKRNDVLVPDVESEVSLQAGILSARERVLRELDAEKARLTRRETSERKAA